MPGLDLRLQQPKGGHDLLPVHAAVAARDPVDAASVELRHGLVGGADASLRRDAPQHVDEPDVVPASAGARADDLAVAQARRGVVALERVGEELPIDPTVHGVALKRQRAAVLRDGVSTPQAGARAHQRTTVVVALRAAPLELRVGERAVAAAAVEQ